MSKSHIIRGGIVINTIMATADEAQAAFPADICIDGSVGGIGWTWDGSQLTAPVVPAPSIEATVVAYEAALDAHLDSVAQHYRFADRTRLALRAGYPNPWQSLGTAFGTWMDTCNALVAAGLQEVIDGKRPIPSVEAMLAALPVFNFEEV